MTVIAADDTTDEAELKYLARIVREDPEPLDVKM
jgi:hypothetical protein